VGAGISAQANHPVARSLTKGEGITWGRTHTNPQLGNLSNFLKASRNFRGCLNVIPHVELCLWRER